MSTNTTKAFRVTNTDSGADLGIFFAPSAREALDAMARDAGHADLIASHVTTNAPGELRDYATDESIRMATEAEYEASLRAGAEGVITVDGRSCYVTGPEVGRDLRAWEIEVSVVLRSGDTGLDTAEEYDAWTSYVCDRIDERAGVYCDVDVEPFKAGGSDTVKTDDRGDDEELVARVRGAIASLWEDWCSEDTAATEPPAVELVSIDGTTDDLAAYATVRVQVDGAWHQVGCMLGAPESDRATHRTAGGMPDGSADAWWTDSSDWASVGAEHRDAALDALRSAAPKLWREARDRDGASS